MKAIKNKVTGDIGFINPSKQMIDRINRHEWEDYELVEVLILEAKPVTEEVINQLCPFDTGGDSIDLQRFSRVLYDTWREGFRAALDYSGIKREDEG